jgi:hypothetical protein
MYCRTTSLTRWLLLFQWYFISQILELHLWPSFEFSSFVANHFLFNLFYSTHHLLYYYKSNLQMSWYLTSLAAKSMCSVLASIADSSSSLCVSNNAFLKVCCHAYYKAIFFFSLLLLLFLFHRTDKVGKTTSSACRHW